MPFEPFIGTLHIALKKRIIALALSLIGQLPIVPIVVLLKASRYASPCLLTTHRGVTPVRLCGDRTP